MTAGTTRKARGRRGASPRRRAYSPRPRHPATRAHGAGGMIRHVRIGPYEVPITNADKIFFPARGLTKGDLVAYYLDMAPQVLAQVRRRPFHMKRFPNGVEGDFFHQKRVPAGHPAFVGEAPVSFPSGHSTVFAVVDNTAALAWVANLGCIELHTWHSRLPEIERPDYLLIDLDPSAEGQWPLVRRIALVVGELMQELGLASFAKTSGATGLHILAPIRPDLPFPDVRRFAKALAEEVERRIGDQRVATTTWRVADRLGVFVDFGQNARDRTIACAYSVRPVADARVSAPLEWDEVADVDPSAFTLETMRSRLAEAGDPMRGMWRRAVSLRPRFGALGLEPPTDERSAHTPPRARSDPSRPHRPQTR
jgi:bifunctional non-homologous end joining protein LigD